MQHKLNITTKVFILMGLILAWVVLPQNVFSQPKLKIGHYKGCSNTEMLIPIEVIDFEEISALTLYIGVDSDNVEYVGIEDINDAFSNGDFIGGDNVDDQITLNWFSLTAANLDSGLMCNVRVLLKQDTSNFNFTDNCEIVQYPLTVLEDVEYSNGSMYAMQTFAIDPISQSVLEEAPALISMLELTEDVSCQWQENIEGNWTNLEDTPPYSGVLTSQLAIEVVSLEMNESLFRCLLSIDACSVESAESQLFVTSSGVDELKEQFISVFPNPTTDYLKCNFASSIQNVDLRLLSSTGEVVLRHHLESIISGEEVSLNLANLSSGVYVLQLLKDNEMISAIKVLKE